MGERIVDFLKQKKEKIVIIDRDPEIVKDYSQKRVYCIYGDADNEEILKKAFLSKAKLIILFPASGSDMDDSRSFAVTNIIPWDYRMP